jgi:predicted small lipoprotein YifL
MKNLSRVSAALLLSMFLLGCGQTGPLYVSGNPSSVLTPTAESDSESDSESEEEQDTESSASE